MSRDFRGIKAAKCRRIYSTVPLTTAPLRSGGRLLLELQDCLLSEEDEELPSAWHVVGAVQHVHLVERPVVIVLVGAQKVVVGDPEGQVIVGTVDAVEAVGRPVGGLVGAVEAFDHLLEGTELFRHLVVIGEADDLGDGEPELFAKLMEELLGGQWVCAVAIGDEAEALWKLLEVAESHAHGQDARADAAAVRDAVSKDGALCGVHDEPDIGLEAADLDVGLVSGEGIAGAIVIAVYERLVAVGGSLAVVCDLLVRDGNAVEVLKGLGCLTQGEA